MDTMIELVSPLFTHSNHFTNQYTVVTSDDAISLGITLVLANFLPSFCIYLSKVCANLMVRI